MKKIFGKYLKERPTAHGIEFYWYQLSGVELVLLFTWPFVLLYLIAFYLGWNEVLGLKILALNTTAIGVMAGFLLLVMFWTLLNRRAILRIESGQIALKKRPLTGAKRVYRRDEVISAGQKLQSQFYESDTGMYPDIYSLYLYLTHSRQVKVGSFNREDAERIIRALQVPVHD